MSIKPIHKLLAPELGLDPNNLSPEDKDKIEAVVETIWDWTDKHEREGNVSMAGGWRNVMADKMRRDRTE
jgi:hypothetical protein